MEKAPPAEGGMEVLCRVARELSIPFIDSTPPASLFIPANGLRMHALDWGHIDKPPIVFLHGGAMTAHTWDLICLHLRADYRCIALDQRGHGFTNGLYSMGVEEPRADTLGAVQSLGLKRFVLVGMSVGGNNAIAYGGVYPQTLAGAVFVDASPGVLPTGYKDVNAHNAAIAATTSFDDAVEASWKHKSRGSKGYRRYLLAHATARFDDGHWHQIYERNLAPLLPPAERTANMAARRDALWSLVPKITCPSLVVHGAESLAQNAATMEEMRSKLPDAKLVQIAGAGHHVQEDQPAALAREIRRFLADIGY